MNLPFGSTPKTSDVSTACDISAHLHKNVYKALKNRNSLLSNDKYATVSSKAIVTNKPSKGLHFNADFPRMLKHLNFRFELLTCDTRGGGGLIFRGAIVFKSLNDTHLNIREATEENGAYAWKY